MMDPRTAAHVLTQIAASLELRGESRFKIRAYEQAARALVALDTDDLAALDRAGTLAGTRGIGPATLSVVRDLIATGESRYLAQLRADTPPGLLELLRVPGLATPKIRLLHTELGVDSVDALEAAVREGRLTTLKGFGPKTAARLLNGISLLRSSGTSKLYVRAVPEARALEAMVRAHPDVARAEVAGSVRRWRETVRDIDIVAACRRDPADVASSFARAPGVREARTGDPASPSISFVDGARLDLFCVAEAEFVVALWRATGSAEHVSAVAARLGERGYTVDGNRILTERGALEPVSDEAGIYALAGLAFVPAEMREGRGEVDMAAAGRLPELITIDDIRGALHCHSDWSDGKASIAEMAEAARARGWSYIGITDHSESAFYAGGLSRDKIEMQHDEIDALNARLSGFRILKGIEADILASGDLDYGADLLDRFDFVVASVHARFSMDRAAMTNRVLRALDDPHLTVLGHPTGRLLLAREGYAIDMDAVLEKAAEQHVSVELNADPHRLDIDWRLLPRARALGIPIEIGPDAHSTRGLDTMQLGVGMARKGGLEAGDVLNARSADDVMAFARTRRAGVR
ncbi:MAG: DNA polymerase/3'-5' exonuclease PolX [Gemmatimonadota bacterium]|nr:DNA polymerase/3'-5' exonuclease PolX [Gemmatimonadota bacterium]